MFHRTTAQASAPIGHHEAEIASPVASKPDGRGLNLICHDINKPQHALHVIDYRSWKALAHLRAIGACNRHASRKLTDDEFDDNMFSIENGDGGIY